MIEKKLPARETDNPTPVIPQVDQARCNLCGLCIDACVCHSVKMGEEGPTFSCPESCQEMSAHPDFFCLGEEVCPTGAISCSFEIVLGSDETTTEDEG